MTSWISRWTVGYGYRPLLALAWFSLLVIVGTLVFAHFYHDVHLVADAEKSHQDFVPLFYTLDKLLPVVSLGFRDAFIPNGAAQAWATVYTILGWLLSVIVIGEFTARMRRD